MRITLSLLLFLMASSIDAVTVIKDSAPEAIIIVAPDAPDSVVYAAKEMQTYLKKVSGAELPIMTSSPEQTDKTLIYIGQNNDLKARKLNTEGLGYDGFKIIAGDKWIALFGRDRMGKKQISGITHPFRLSESYTAKFKINRFGETGTLFAVYHFLERFCGIRWYMPGELGEVVPQQATIEIPEKTNFATTPDFEYRFLYNCDFRDDDDSALWYRRAGFGAPFPVNIIHSFHTVFRKYRQSHPEYFALIDGKRDLNISCSGEGNLCLSNPEVLKYFAEAAREFFDKNPDQSVFPVMPNDSFIRLCDCPECQKQIVENEGFNGKFSNYVWSFVNNVAREVYKTHPDKFIGCCAYTTYQNPPDCLPELSPNVIVMICKKSSDYWNPEYKKRIMGLIDSWSRKVKTGNLYCWEYYNWICFHPYSKNVPVLFLENIAEDIKDLKGKCKGEFIEAETWNAPGEKIKKACFPGLTHLNYYTTAKLMWNADTDLNKLREEYYTLFYGRASADMKKFFEQAEILWNSKILDRKDELYRKLYTSREVGQLMELLYRGRATTSEGSKEQKRIDLVISEIKPLYERVNNQKLTQIPVYNCQYVSSGPKIDGKADDLCWENKPLMVFSARTGDTIVHPSTAKACFDDKNIYLLFKNHASLSDPATFQSSCTQKDSIIKPYIWEDESIEIFFSPVSGPDKKYYQFIINVNGVIWDGLISKEFRQNPSMWNSNIETATETTNNSWTLEVKIPLSDIGLTGQMPWSINGNFIHNNNENGVCNSSCWSPTMTDDNKARPGKIILKR